MTERRRDFDALEPGSTVSAHLVALVLATVRDAGADAGGMLARARLEPPADDPRARIPHRAAFELLDAAIEATGDAALGLHAAERLRPGSFGTIDYLVRNSATLGDAVSNAARYQRLLQDAELRLDVSAGRAVQSYRLRDPLPMSRALAECVLAGATVWSRQLTGTPLAPLEVRFTHRRPRHAHEHERFFRAPIRYGSDEDALVLPARALELPVVGADPDLAAVLAHEARRLVDDLPCDTRMTDRVRDVLARELRGPHGRGRRVAARLHMSPRTLRRRLRGRGTSLRRLLDELRRGFAIHYLRDRGLSIAETGFLLGFEDAAAFHKAFRRWTGETPGVVRGRGGALGS